MAPRASARFASTSSTPTAPRALSAIPQPIAADTPQLAELRKQWKWAAVSQFLYTFAPLVNLESLSLTQVEIDLTFGTMDVLPRLMQRLLYTLTQDRKISLDSWQTALRKQYLRRDPEANPIGWELQAINTQSPKVSSEPEASESGAQSAVGDDKGQLDSSIHATTVEVLGESSNTEKSVKEEPQSNGVDDETLADHEDRGAIPPQKDWVELSMLEKLESLHTLMEWHFQTPTRLRSMMRSDDEQATWRIEPIGFNSKQDAYWLIGLDRLWIQHAPPKAPRKNLKRKAPPIGGSRKAMRAGENARSEQTARSSSHRNYTKGTDNSASRPKEPSRKGKAKEELPANPRARAAKSEAKLKLDEQAKQLVAAKAEMKALGRRKSVKDVWPEESPSSKHVVGTRVSRRLRGVGDDDWQPIPPEWLAGDHDKGTGRSRTSTRPANGTAKVVEIRKTGLESDDDSELTELSDTELNSPNEDNVGSSRRSHNSTAHAEAVARSEVATMESDDKKEGSEAFEPPQPSLPDVWPPPNFVEWETVCVTLAEWETVATQFEHATHYAEKALYKILVQDIVPSVTSMLRDIEKQRQKEEAVVHRKRSSRIAVKEGEKEEARLAAQRKAEEEERLSRARRAEARAKKEEEDRLKRELAREQRRKEREEREERLRTGRSQDGESSHDGMMVDVVHDDGSASGHIFNGAKFAASQMNYDAKGQRKGNGKGKEHHSNGDDWELDCQICGVKGINRDDGLPLMSCGVCGKWQHIPCHDAEDVRRGRPKRNWDVVDFTCNSCHSYPRSRPAFPPVATKTHLSDTRHSTHRTSLDAGVAVNGHSTFLRSHPSSTPSHPYSLGSTPHHVQPQPSVTFAHYQPLRHGFSPHVPTPERQHPGYDYSQQMVTSNDHPSPYTAIAAQETVTRPGIAGKPYLSVTQPYYNSSNASGYSNVVMTPAQNIRTNGSPAHTGSHTYDSPVHTNAHQHISTERSMADAPMGYNQAGHNAAGSFTAYPQYSGVHQYPKAAAPQYHQSHPRG
ncbi:hypothetical protein BD410DRAFT_797206 [Rickenella mellea]|uniref:PHD-type domain-containing protein n=1 Tax=Rickenella mellea TaxID=50990 RepID=A0A4Y7PHE6_9AGAM|nr:hypothetical protein BD410DRAFT_797206 [Rickenella mellea]